MTDQIADPLRIALPLAVEAANKIRDIIALHIKELPDHNVGLSMCVLLVISIQKQLVEHGQCPCKACVREELMEDWIPLLSIIAGVVGLGTKDEAEAQTERLRKGTH